MSDNTKPCVKCLQPIPKGATKCFHCESFQNWRSYVSASSTVLSLLVALFAVLAVTIPTIASVFTSELPSVTVVPLDCERGRAQLNGQSSTNVAHFRFFVSNTGSSAAVIKNATFRGTTGNKIVLFGATQELDSDRHVLPPKGYQTVRFTLLNPPDAFPPNARVAFEIVGADDWNESIECEVPKTTPTPKNGEQ